MCRYTAFYDSPVGKIRLTGTENALTGVWFAGQKYDCAGMDPSAFISRCSPVLTAVQLWLDRYFRGEQPGISGIPLAPEGSPFRKIVWQILREIPYGETRTYGDIARKTAKRMGRKSMSAQAVGSAVGHNPISILIPCHRVIGADGTLTGYAGGLVRKQFLLDLEQKNPRRQHEVSAGRCKEADA